MKIGVFSKIGLAWYDNEMGYAHTLLRHVKETGRYAKNPEVRPPELSGGQTSGLP